MATVSHLGILLLLPFFLTESLAANEDLLITTKNGQVQGKALSVLGGEVRAFLGIPYGKPPVGNLRFRAPQPVDKWEGVKDATRFPNTCYQIEDTVYPGFSGAEMWNPNTPLSEDCLYLNIWTPRFNSSQTTLLPVMIWIYGGSFTSGSSSLDLYDGRYLSKSENIVVASMNYRLGVFGFLTLPDNNNVSGNAGLLDQRMAIQWVVNNIAAFGGDSSKVTLFGESAGSASVGFQVLSPGSNVLFQRAVMQSGVPTASWALTDLNVSRTRGEKLGTLLGCSTSDPADLETCMQQADVAQVAQLQNKVLSSSDIISIPFQPVVDGVFLPDKPDVLLSSGNAPKINLLLGLNHDEGTYFLPYGVPGFSNTGESLITRSQFLQAVDFVSSDTVLKQAIIFEYSDWADVNNSTKNRDFLGQIITDLFFICPVQQFASRFAQSGGKNHLYFFTHRSSINPWPEWMGVMHGYEIEFVFGRPLNSSLGYTQAEVNMSRNFMKHWANFARTGYVITKERNLRRSTCLRPTPCLSGFSLPYCRDPGINGNSWSLFTPETKEHYTLNTNPPEMKSVLRADQCHFWTELVPQIRQLSADLEACKAGGLTLGCNSTILVMLLLLLFTF